MNAFFGAIGLVGFLIGLVLIALGLIKKKKYKGGIIALVSLIIFIVAGITDTSTNEASSKPLSTEEQIVKTLGEETNEDKERIDDIEYGEFTKLTLNGDQPLSNKDMKITFLNNAAEAFPIVFKDSKVEKAMVTIKTTFVDEYGKKYDDDGIRVMLTRETYEKITWENFNVENFEQVADSLYTHPALSKAAKE